ncbi:hypothetical protein Y032_0614g686 [Ancylostoma ceylanicum]|uniref:Uncharacterized protein n=1 Tax=Ancylostoma ceylanicum TaxID=53326 RepID=A0A016WL76_9BILA|nr:hypothetical protein Y032_0614g686 [Ancylostoma ceylanicum]
MVNISGFAILYAHQKHWFLLAFLALPAVKLSYIELCCFGGVEDEQWLLVGVSMFGMARMGRIPQFLTVMSVVWTLLGISEMVINHN